MRQGKAQALNLKNGGNLYIQCSLERKVNTGKLNTNSKQESKYKAHLKQSYSKCLTTRCKDS